MSLCGEQLEPDSLSLLAQAINSCFNYALNQPEPQIRADRCQSVIKSLLTSRTQGKGRKTGSVWAEGSVHPQSRGPLIRNAAAAVPVPAPAASQRSPGRTSAGVNEVRQALGSSASIQGRLFLAQPPARIAFPPLSFSFTGGSGGSASDPAGAANPGRRRAWGRSRSSPGFAGGRENNYRAQLNATRCEKLETGVSCPGAAGGSQGHGGGIEPQIPRQSAASQEPG